MPKPLFPDSTAKPEKPGDVPAEVWDFMSDEQKARYSSLSGATAAARPAIQAIGDTRGEMGAQALEQALADFIEAVPGEPYEGGPVESYASPVSAMTEAMGQELDRQREDNAAIIAANAAERSHMLWQVQYEMAKKQRQDDLAEAKKQRRHDRILSWIAIAIAIASVVVSILKK